MCDSCDYDCNNIEDDRLDVCKECRSKKPSLLITKTKALELYPLSKDDFDNVRHIQYNGVFVTYLYLIKDIEYLCVKKHGSKEKSDAVIEKKLNKKLEKKKYIEDSRNFRRKELDDYLKSICLPGIRNDSVLCENYINQGIVAGFTKEEIGVIMTEMKFYYEKTNYSKILYKMKGDELEDRKEHRGWYCWTDSDEEDVRERSKRKALYDYIERNCNNSHQIILEIPKSLKPLADEYYGKLWRQGKIGNIIKPVTLNKKTIKYNTLKEICNIFKESNRKFKKTESDYSSLGKYITPTKAAQ